MDRDITDTGKIGKTFSMLHNQAILARIDSLHTPGNLFDPGKMAAQERESNALEQVDAYAARFLASGAHLERGHKTHKLPDQLRDAVQPVEEFIGREFRHRTGGSASAFERQQLVEYIDQYATDRDEVLGRSLFGHAEPRELNAMLPPERQIKENTFQLLRQREAGDGLAGAKLQLQTERKTGGGERPLLDADGFDALPQALVDFRSRLAQSVRDQDTLFQHTSVADEGLYGPQVDWHRVTKDPQARRAAMDTLDGEIAAMNDPQVMRVNHKQEERSAAAQSFSGELSSGDDEIRSPPPGDGAPQPKRPRLDDRDRSRGSLGL